MAWKKSPPALIETFDAVLPGAPAERRSMFGYPAAFVNGNLFMSLFEDEHVAAPEKLVGDRAALGKWAAKALAHGQSLPPKQKKPTKKKTAR